MDETQTYHAFYMLIKKSHHELPNRFTPQECTRILTAVMAAKSFSWRVVGITPAALIELVREICTAGISGFFA